MTDTNSVSPAVPEPQTPVPLPATVQPPPTPPVTPPPAAVADTRDNRGSVVAGAILILIGAAFLSFNVLHIDFGQVWPIIFFFIAAGFYLPVLLSTRNRAEMAGLLIPGTILAGLGVIFFYNTLTDDWGSWAYIWAFIPASVGLGLLIAARVGHWGGEPVTQRTPDVVPLPLLHVVAHRTLSARPLLVYF